MSKLTATKKAIQESLKDEMSKRLEASIKGVAPDNVYIEHVRVFNEYVVSMMYGGVLMYLSDVSKNALKRSLHLRDAIKFSDLSACKIMRDDALDPAYHNRNVKILRVS